MAASDDPVSQALPAGEELSAALAAPSAGLPAGWVLHETYEVSSTSAGVGREAAAKATGETVSGKGYFYGPAGEFSVQEAVQKGTPYIAVRVMPLGTTAADVALPGMDMRIVTTGREDVVFAAPAGVGFDQLDTFITSVMGPTPSGAVDEAQS